MNKTFELLKELEKLSPVAEMGAGFKGNHSILMTRDETPKLSVNVWRKGRCWPVIFGQEDLDQTDMARLAASIVFLIDDAIKKSEISQN